MDDERSQVIARLMKFMQKDEGWRALMPGEFGEAYARFKRTVDERFPSKKQRQRALDTLLLELAALFVDKAIENGLSYGDVAEDLTEMEQKLNDR